MKRFKIYLIAFFLLFLSVNHAILNAQEVEKYRFVSIKSTEANVRVGPSMRYPIKWVYKRKNLPVKIVTEFGQWKKILDIDNEGGWIHESLISKSRHVLIKDKIQEVYYKPIASSVIVMKVEAGVVAEHLEFNGQWSKIKIGKISGWIPSEYLFGV